MSTLPPDLAAQARLETPLGTVTVAATDRGLAGLWFDGQSHHPGLLAAPVDAEQRWIRAASASLARYFDGDATAFDELPLDLGGTPFQRAVWQALRRIRHGGTARYADIARRVGRPQAARAAGAAIGRNPVSIVVPCHRVVGSDGSLTGYAGGLPRKQALLALEAAARR